MERTVSGISGMIGEFAALIEAQSELVDGIDRFESEGRIGRAEGSFFPSFFPPDAMPTSAVLVFV